MTKPVVVQQANATASALRASEDRFATAFYSSPIAMAITTVDEGRYLDVNEAFERQMGYARAEICGRTSIEMQVWPAPADRDAMIAALQLDKYVRDQPAQFRTSTGDLITTRYSAGIISVDGVPCVLAGIVDVTAQKQAEQALRESESKFRLLTEMTQSGIFIYREDGSFCYFNPQMVQATGYSPDELRSLTVWDLVHPDFRETVKARAEARLRGEPLPSRSEFQMITKAGESRWLDLSARLIEFEGRPAVLGTGFDITDSKHLAQRLTRVQDEERAHIARELHDDIGQRLALLTIQLAQLQKTARSDASSIGASLDTTRRLADEICADAQRISHRLHPSQLAVLGLTKALAGLCEGFVARTDAEIDFVHDDIPRLPREVSACLFRIAQEALLNATKHSQSRRIIVELSMLPDAILLSVSDDGRGFDPASAERGGGLGLVSMTERARSVGGQAAVRSAVGRGTRVDVTIPLPQLNRSV